MKAKARIRFRLALRNLRRQRRRSILSGSAMVLAMALLIFSRTLAEGGHEDWIEAGVRLGSGHVALQHPEYQARRTLEFRLTSEKREAAEAALASSSVAGRVVATAPRLAVQGLASSPSAALPVAIVAMDPASETRFSALQEDLSEGRYLEPDDRLRALVGTGLAERLKLKLHSRFVLTAQDADGQIVGQMVRVAGVFRTGIPEVDEGFVQIPLATAQEWLAAPGAVTGIAVLLRSSHDVGSAARALRAALSDESSLDVVDWRRTMPELDAAVRMDDWADYIFHIVLFVIAATAIINTVLMSVMQRTREFGVLRALGLERGQVGRLVFTEGLFLTLVSGTAGVALGAAVVWIFFRHGLDFSAFWDTEMSAAGVVIDPVIVPRFHWSQLLWSMVVMLGIGCLASVYPAWRATRVDVAEAMKFDE